MTHRLLITFRNGTVAAYSIGSRGTLHWHNVEGVDIMDIIVTALDDSPIEHSTIKPSIASVEND